MALFEGLLPCETSEISVPTYILNLKLKFDSIFHSKNKIKEYLAITSLHF